MVCEVQLGLDLFVVCEVGVFGKHASQLAQEVVRRVRILSTQAMEL